MHEPVNREPEVEGSSNKAFGLVFCGAFALIAIYPLIHGGSIRAWAGIVAIGFAVAAITAPRLLAPMNRAWTKLGFLLHRIVNPVVLGIMFFLVVTPTGLLMRALGKNPLRLRFEPDQPSYWIRREPPGPPAESFKDQF